jgi:hypothetical protein
MGMGGGGGDKEVIVGFLEAAVDDVAERGWKEEGTIGEISKRWRGGRMRKVRVKEREREEPAEQNKVL